MNSDRILKKFSRDSTWLRILKKMFCDSNWIRMFYFGIYMPEVTRKKSVIGGPSAYFSNGSETTSKAPPPRPTLTGAHPLYKSTTQKAKVSYFFMRQKSSCVRFR